MKQAHFKFNKITLVFFVIIISVWAIGCKKDSNTRTAIFNVAPTLHYSGLQPPASSDDGLRPYMQVTEGGSKDTILVYIYRIENFTYEEGYSYVLKVEITKVTPPPADGYPEDYRLISIISKEKE